MIEEKPMTVDDIVVSIKLRLAEIDFEILDSKKSLKEAGSIGGHSCYGSGYESGALETLRQEQITLCQIMTGYYKGIDKDDR